MNEETEKDFEVSQEIAESSFDDAVSQADESIEAVEEIHTEDENTQTDAESEAESSEEPETINAEEFKQILNEWALEIQSESSESEEESETSEESEAENEAEPEPEPIIIETDYSEYFETLTESRSFLTTPFEDYTVTEGFCLLFLLCLVVAAIYHMFRRFV